MNSKQILAVFTLTIIVAFHGNVKASFLWSKCVDLSTFNLSDSDDSSSESRENGPEFIDSLESSADSREYVDALESFSDAHNKNIGSNRNVPMKPRPPKAKRTSVASSWSTDTNLSTDSNSSLTNTVSLLL